MLDEAKYQIQRFSRIDEYLNEDRAMCIIPLETIFNMVFPLTKSMNELRKTLREAGYHLTEQDQLEVGIDEDDGLDSNSDDYMNDLPGNYEDQDLDLDLELAQSPIEDENWD